MTPITPEQAQVVEWLREALDMDEAWAELARAIVALKSSVLKPDHRVCQCGHVGSVHEAAPGTPKTALGWPTVGAGRCHGFHGDTPGSARPCPCGSFEEAWLEPLPDTEPR